MSEKPLDFSRLSWFVSGLVIGSIFHTTTTLVLILSWIIVTNERLPAFLGGYYPQNILKGLFNIITNRFTSNKKDKVDVSSENTKLDNEIKIVQSLQPRQPLHPHQPIQSLQSLQKDVTYLIQQPALTLSAAETVSFVKPNSIHQPMSIVLVDELPDN